jgi:epoxide hydrolase-like predicted phosphatase
VLDAVIFDLGGVLLANGRPSDAVGHFPGVDPDALVAAITGPPGEDGDHPWHRLERGEITMREYQLASREHLAALGIPRPSAAPGTERARPRFEFFGNDAMLELVCDLRSAGVRTGMLTNNAKEMRPHWWPVADWLALFDDIVDSHEVGIRKPNPAIYALALQRLGVTADRAVFLDDLAANVEGAAAVGLPAIHVVGRGEAAISEVRRRAGLSPRGTALREHPNG